MSESEIEGDDEEWQLSGDLDPREVELLRLELRRLARQYGVEVAEFRVERDPEAPAEET